MRTFTSVVVVVISLSLVACHQGALTPVAAQPIFEPGPVEPFPVPLPQGPLSPLPREPPPSLSSYLGLFARGGDGPFRLTLSHDSGGWFPTRTQVSSAAWLCPPVVLVDEPGHAALLLHGCTITGVNGDFDFEVHLKGRTLGKVELTTVVANRLDQGIFDARVVLRMPAVVAPASPDTYLLYGVDEWVKDPVTQMTLQRRVPNDFFIFYTADDATHGFYNGIQNMRPMVSIHRPGFGLMIHDTDPDNAAPGRFAVGSNDGALEVAYTWVLAGELSPSMQVAAQTLSPSLRTEILPGKLPADVAWNESAQAYRSWGQSVGLFPTEPLAKRASRARWAQDCLYLVVGLSTSVTGVDPATGQPSQADVAGWRAYMERAITFYGARGQRSFCPMMWGWSAVGPYQPIAGVEALLAEFRALEQTHGVEIHPGIYVLSIGFGGAVMGTPLEATLYQNARGQPLTWGDGIYLADPGHPLFVAEVERTVTTMMSKGVDWVYFDNPFSQWQLDPRIGGTDLKNGRSTRALLKRVDALLAKNGGGVVACEVQRTGVSAAYGAGSGTAVPGAENVPVTELLVHDLEFTGSFGDPFGSAWEVLAADPAFGGDVPGAASRTSRLGIVGAAYGRTGMTGNQGPTQGWFDFSSPTAPAHQAALYQLDASGLRNGQTARRSHDALRTGRMLLAPRTDGGKVALARRRFVPTATGFGFSDTIHAVGDRYPAAFFASVEKPGTHTLTVANPESTAAVVQVQLRVEDYPSMAGVTVWKRVGMGPTVAVTATDLSSFTVTVPPQDVLVVELQPVL